jgi:hypothetical protein
MIQKWLLLLVLLLPFWQMNAHAEDVFAGTISRVSGAVEIVRQSKSFSAEKGVRLFEGDRIDTKKKGAVGMILRDNTRLSLGASSSLTIVTFRFAPIEEEYALDLELSEGKFLYHSGLIGKVRPRAIRCLTPIGTVGTLGTKFLVNLEGEGRK